METAGVTAGQLRSPAVGLCVMVALLIEGSAGLVCYTAVESLDLGCLLRWDCPHASPNTTYTVQTKTQGDPWRDVSWCVQISSCSCDVSQAFSNFDLYNMIRLGAHPGPGSTVWIGPRKFDYSDFTFSPPSASVSFKDDRLLVKVQFPCAANRRCSLGTCCPISELIDPWTTVTVYNELNPFEYQSRTVWTQEAVIYVDFSGLAPGQNYCAVANFSFPTFSMAASSKSAPQCVETNPESKPGLLPVLCLGIGLTALLLVPLLAGLLQRLRREPPAPENRPKTPVSVQDPVSSIPLSPVILDPCEIHVEFDEDQISIQSSSSLPSDPDRTPTSGCPSDALCHDPSSGAAYWDSGGLEQGRGLDSGISIPPASHSSEETSGTN